MTILEKIKKCVSLVWDFQEIYGEEDIEDFCHNELSTYPQHDEIMEYFKQIENLEMTVGTLRTFSNEQATCIEQLEKENAELKTDYEVLSCSVGDFGELQDKLEEEQRKNNELFDKLAEAKEIISEYVRLANLEKEDTIAIWQLYHKAEQFLNGENIILEDAQAGNSPFDADEIFNKEMKAYSEEKVK